MMKVEMRYRKPESARVHHGAVYPSVSGCTPIKGMPRKDGSSGSIVIPLHVAHVERVVDREAQSLDVSKS